MAEAPGEEVFSIPAARSTNLLSREEDGELLLYDEQRQQVHRLNHCAASVWRKCDGSRTVAEIVRKIAEQQPSPIVTEESVQDAIHQLAEADLLVAPPPGEMRVRSPSRRGLIKQAAIAAGAAIAVPVVVSLTAPKSAFASGLVEGGPCDDYHSCPDMMVCCHRPGYGAGDRCWSDADLCVM